MQTQVQPQPTDYAKAIAALVAKMSRERAAQVYDFVRFLQSQPVAPLPISGEEDDWLNDTEEQMQTEDDLWEAARARHPDKFAALAAAARAEISAGTTQSMFTANGELALP